MAEEFITIKETARILNVNPATLRRWDKKGKLKASRHPFNNYRIYNRSEVEELRRQILYDVNKRGEKIEKRIKDAQDRWIEFYKKSFLISRACLGTKINRSTFYDWMKKYPEFKERVKEADEDITDFVRVKLYEKIKNHSLPAIKYFLKETQRRKWNSSRFEKGGRRLLQ